MPRDKRPVVAEVGNITQIRTEGPTDEFVHGSVRATGHVISEPDRPVAVYFTNPGNARSLARALLAWADSVEPALSDTRKP